MKIDLSEEALRVKEGAGGTDAREARIQRVREEARQILLRDYLAELAANFSGRDDTEEGIRTAIRQVVGGIEIPDAERRLVVGELEDQLLGLGPLTSLLADHSVTEVMVVAPNLIYVEVDGDLRPTGIAFADETQVRELAVRISWLSRGRLDEKNPIMDAVLPNGARVNVLIPPIASDGHTKITIRKAPGQVKRIDAEILVRNGALSEGMLRFYDLIAQGGLTTVVGGPTGTGKTVQLRVIMSRIPAGKRLVISEERRELRPDHPHAVEMQELQRDENPVTMHDLQRAKLRLRPDWDILGEIRDEEFPEWLEAAWKGHPGLTSLHAETPEDILDRGILIMARRYSNLSPAIIERMVRRTLQVAIFCRRFSDGTRRVVRIAEILPVEEGRGLFEDLFRYDQASGRHLQVGALSVRLREMLAERRVAVPQEFSRGSEGANGG